MEYVINIYKFILNKNDFYYSYFRIFLLFFLETKKNDDLIYNKNVNNNLNYYECNKLNNEISYEDNFISKYIDIIKPHIIFVNGECVYIDTNRTNLNINIIENVNNFTNFFEFQVYNNLNLPYILNFISLSKEINIYINSINNQSNIYIINIFNETINKNILSTIKCIYFNENVTSSVTELYKSYAKNMVYNITNFIQINSNSLIKYNFLNKNDFHNTFLITFNTKQDTNSTLKFCDIYNDSNDFDISHNFFLIGKNSTLLYKTFKKSLKKNIDLRNYNIYHYHNNTKSLTHFGILADKETKFIFIGNIIVGTQLKYIEADLKCDGLILSDNSHIEFNPNMFINSNDVKCSHGANIGNISEVIMKYIQSRGINELAAKQIIIDIFINKYYDEDNQTFFYLYDNLIDKTEFNYE